MLLMEVGCWVTIDRTMCVAGHRESTVPSVHPAQTYTTSNVTHKVTEKQRTRENTHSSKVYLGVTRPCNASDRTRQRSNHCTVHWLSRVAQQLHRDSFLAHSPQRIWLASNTADPAHCTDCTSETYGADSSLPHRIDLIEQCEKAVRQSSASLPRQVRPLRQATSVLHTAQ